MEDIKIRSDSVNVEHIMQQIRARIREKRGVDYTEQQIRDLAAAAFERFLDPKGARGGLLEAFRQGRVPPSENSSFEDTTLFDSHRAPLRWIRRLLRPVLKLFFNPNPLIQALHQQSGVNERNTESARMTYELLYNLVLETTRLTVELQALKMRVESAAARLDFAERRSRVPHRAQETPPAPQGRARGGHVRTPAAPPTQPAQLTQPTQPAQPTPPAQPTQPAQPTLPAQGQAGADAPAVSAARPQPARDGDQAGGSEARRRKRRRRGRRGGASRGPSEVVTEGAEGSTDTGGDTAPADDREGPAAPDERHDEPTGRDAGAETPPPADREEQ
jgi:hypothetical protein